MTLDAHERLRVSASPQQGIIHGPHRPLTEAGIEHYRQWEGEEYDLTNMDVQRLHQLRENVRAAYDATQQASIAVPDVLYVRDLNEAEIKWILDLHLDRR